MDRDEMSILYRGPSIDASYQVSVHLARRFQRRRFLKVGQSETRISDWTIFFKSSPLKPLGQINQNLVESIYGRSSIKFAHFIPIRYQTWPPQAILVSVEVSEEKIKM
jgi:hypothetical protein